MLGKITNPKIDVCIATYMRPNLLRKLLSSLITQETNDEFTFSIIVVDNDAQRSAERTVEKFKTNGQNIIYDVEPDQNISLARNRAISHTTGDYIATIDDDEYADSKWLLNLFKTIISYEADLVFGPVFRIFDKKPPKYIIKSGAFTRPNPPTGSNDNYVYYTANSLFRRRLIEHMATPFNPSFGKTGGSDTALFKNLKDQGYKMIWCREAQVFEFVPRERANLIWILKRDFRIGNGYHRVFNKGFVDPSLTKSAKIRHICTKILRLFRAFLFHILLGIFNSQYTLQAIKDLRKIALRVGIIAYFLNFQYEEYREKRSE